MLVFRRTLTVVGPKVGGVPEDFCVDAIVPNVPTPQDVFFPELQGRKIGPLWLVCPSTLVVVVVVVVYWIHPPDLRRYDQGTSGWVVLLG